MSVANKNEQHNFNARTINYPMEYARVLRVNRFEMLIYIHYYLLGFCSFFFLFKFKTRTSDLIKYMVKCELINLVLKSHLNKTTKTNNKTHYELGPEKLHGNWFDNCLGKSVFGSASKR